MKTFRVYVDEIVYIVKADDVLQGFDVLTFGVKDETGRTFIVGQFKYWDTWSSVDDQFTYITVSKE